MTKKSKLYKLLLNSTTLKILIFVLGGNSQTGFFYYFKVLSNNTQYPNM